MSGADEALAELRAAHRALQRGLLTPSGRAAAGRVLRAWARLAAAGREAEARAAVDAELARAAARGAA